MTDTDHAFAPENVEVACPQCRRGMVAPVTRIVDSTDDRTLRAFIGDGLNIARCQSCGAVSRLAIPVLFHNAEKDAAYVYVPPELGLALDRQEREIGQLTNRVLASLPAEQRRMYLLQPKVFLTPESFRIAALETVGIAESDLDGLRRASERVDALLSATDEAALDLAISAWEGDPYSLLVFVRQLADGSKEIGDLENVARLEALHAKLVKKLGGTTLTLDEVIGELTQAKDEGRLDAAVAYFRPVLDYSFFVELTARIDAGDDSLAVLRGLILEAVDRVDEAARAALEAAADTLRAILTARDLDAALEANMDRLDETFFLILEANRAAAEEANPAIKLALDEVHSRAVGLLGKKSGEAETRTGEPAVETSA